MTRRRPLTALFASAIALLASPASAEAGTYDVSSCDAGGANVNNAWVFETNDSAHIEAGTACGTYQSYSGVYARTRLGSANAPPGALGQWIFRAPTGTTITRMQMTRWLGMEGGTGWRLYGRQADDTILSGEACTVPVGADECNVGGSGSTPIDRSLSTTSIAYGFECISSYDCITGSTIHSARAAIHTAKVTINDPTAPSLTAPTGALVNESGYHGGTESVSFNGSDTTGLKTLRVYIDGIERASQALTCDYTKVVPCSNPSSAQALSVNLAAVSGGTRLIPDGTRLVEVAAVDAAGNEIRSAAKSIVVDATAPAAPTALTPSIGSGWQASRDLTATWTHPANQVAPINTAHWSFCPAGTTTGCKTGSAWVPASSGTLSGLQVPGEGAWDLTVRLQDAAGNTAAADVAKTTVRYDATAPAASPNLGLAGRTETDQAFQAHFNPPADQVAPVTEAVWTLCPQNSPGCTSGTLATDPNQTNYLRTTIPSYGDWTLTVRLRDQAGHLGAPATTSLRYVATAAPAVTPAPTATPAPSPAVRASAKLRVTAALLDRSRRTVLVRGRTVAKATGAVRILVSVTRGDRTRKLAKSFAIRNGRFTGRLRLSRRDSRGRFRIAVVYAGSATYAPDRTRRSPVRVR